MSNASRQRHNFYSLFFLCLFLGWLGAHRFYVGKVGTGLLQLATLGGVIWWPVDTVTILLGRFEDKDGAPIPNINPKLSWSVFGMVIVALAAYVTTVYQSQRARVVEGKRMPYSITVPDGWRVEQQQSDNYDLAMFAENKTLWVGVIVEEPVFDNTEAFATSLRDYMRKATADTATLSEIAPITIDGRIWRTFRVRLRSANGITTILEACVYTGPEGTFRVVGWTLDRLFDQNAGKLRKVMHSFRFPKAQIK
jgi:TM2 domain-containing membrane protein YozV